MLARYLADLAQNADSSHLEGHETAQDDSDTSGQGQADSWTPTWNRGGGSSSAAGHYSFFMA